MEELHSLSTDIIAPGSVIASRYEVVRCIGTGGMASVYLVHDRALDNRPLALKVLHRQFTEDKRYVERFIREVRVMNQVDHPNVVKTHDIGGEDGALFFTMDFVDGTTLEEIIDSRAFTATEIADLTIEICKGLEGIHQHGVLHRDLKPGNILITNDGLVKIADFGVAHEAGSRLTERNQKLGSIYYIAPEIWLGRAPTNAVDLYSLGIVLYELATGSLPFDESIYPGQVMSMHLDEEVLPPKARRADLPDWLDKLIMRLLAKSPRQRFKQAREVIEAVTPHCTAYSRSLGVEGASRIQPALVSESATRAAVNGKHRGKTYIFKLRATRLLNESGQHRILGASGPHATVTIPLPSRAAVIFKIEPPSRDFIYLGVFLASLQVFDGVLTSLGLERMGVHAEANPLLRYLMHHVGPTSALLVVKGMAVFVVLVLTVLARKMRWIKDLIAALSCLYLMAAIVPWLYVLGYLGSRTH